MSEISGRAVAAPFAFGREATSSSDVGRLPTLERAKTILVFESEGDVSVW